MGRWRAPKWYLHSITNSITEARESGSARAIDEGRLAQTCQSRKAVVAAGISLVVYKPSSCQVGCSASTDLPRSEHGAELSPRCHTPLGCLWDHGAHSLLLFC